MRASESLRLLVLGGLLAACLCPVRAQFARAALDAAAARTAEAQSAQGPIAGVESFGIKFGVKLPQCPGSRILLTDQGVPGNWSRMSPDAQVADPSIALILQLAYAVWQDDPAAKLGACLVNMGIDEDSIKVIHRRVRAYGGTMTALVMRAGDRGVFVSFRGTDFDDPGDVLTDADCQHTPNLGDVMFGSTRNVRLHTGFFNAWDALAGDVEAAINAELARVRPVKGANKKQVFFIGHSLGASIASIAALRSNHLWRGSDTEVGGVWLFGCPRVGNPGWRDEFNEQLMSRTLRVSNYADFAARLPLQTQLCPLSTLTGVFQFAHVGQALLLCPNYRTGLVDWRISPSGTENLDCHMRPDPPDLTVTTHWLGSYLDAWRRGYASALNSYLNDDPRVLAVMCDECSLNFPLDRAKQLNVVARAGGPMGCSTSASCNKRTAFNAVAQIGDHFLRKFNPASICLTFVCT